MIVKKLHREYLISDYKEKEENKMTDYIISEAKVDVGSGGMACGPISGPVVGEAKFTALDGSFFYVSLAEIDGLPQFYKTPKSTFDNHINLEGDEEFWKEMNTKYYLPLGEYSDILENKEDDMFDIYRFLIYIVRCDWDSAKVFIEETEGKHISEIEIPATDIEEEMWDESEEE